MACFELCLGYECKNLVADNLQFEMPEYGPDGGEVDSDSVEIDVETTDSLRILYYFLVGNYASLSRLVSLVRASSSRVV